MTEPKPGEKTEDRRSYPRAELSVRGVLLADDGHEIEISSINISESGMLIVAREPVEEFTLISAVIRLPGPDNGEEDKEVYCEGIVVRIEYHTPSEFPYRLAVHFYHLESEARAAIRDVVKRKNGAVQHRH